MTKVVIVSTSAATCKGHPTGLWLEELAVPYYQFKSLGYEIILASPTGGPIPIDASSLRGDYFNDDCKKFMHDDVAIGEFCHSAALDSIDFSGVDAIVMCGGHGTCADFYDNAALKSAIEELYAADKVVAAVCHGPMCLPQCNKPDGTPLVEGKAVTGFKDSEEQGVGLVAICPFLLESKLKEVGGKYECADDWNPHVCVDGKLVTGQNPASAHAFGAAVISLLSP